MAEWIYEGKEYKTIPYVEGTEPQSCIGYVPKWNKCFLICFIGHHGNGSREKACLKDIYSGKVHFIEARRLELVVQKN